MMNDPTGRTSRAQRRAPRWRHVSGDVVEAEELTIAIYRRVGSHETWVAIANDTHSVEVSLESAVRLSGELAALLNEVTTEPA